MIRITGMNSGLDTDAIIQELVKASSEKKTKLEKAQTKLEWKQDAWKELNSKIYTFYNKFLDNMRWEGSYKKKTTKVADSSIASIITSANAINGSQTLAVKQLAKSGYLTGGKLDGSYKTSSTMADIGAVAEGESATIEVNGTSISLDSSTTISSFVSKLNKAGVEASFDKDNQRFFISAKKSGEANDFSITAGDANGLEALKSLKLLTAEDATNNKEYQTWANMTEAELSQRISNTSAERALSFYNAAGSLTAANDKLAADQADIRQKMSDYGSSQDYRDAMDAVDPSGVYTAEDAVQDLESKISTIKEEKSRFDELSAKEASDLTADEQAELADLTAKQSSWDALEGHEKNLAVISKYTDYQKQITNIDSAIAANDAAIAEYQSYYTETTDADGKVTPEANSKMTDVVRSELEAKIQTAKDAIAAAGAVGAGGSGAVRILGQDAKIELNGAEFSSAGNSFTVNGLTITAQAVSEQNVDGTYKTTTINTADDVDGIYNMVKEFLGEYNSLIKEMDSLYNADSSKGYEPLTSEEKEAMSDDEIKLWEKKIKDALLRKDSTLDSVVGTLKNGMMQSFTINGQKYSLNTFGINTLGYFNASENEHGVYHIDGDSEDADSMSNPDRLKTAIANDSSSVVSFFTQLANNLYKNVNEYMKSNEYSSRNKVYDDKRMKSEYDDYKEKIKKQETKLKDMEDKYYKQFSAMETALAKLNSQQSALSSMFSM